VCARFSDSFSCLVFSAFRQRVLRGRVRELPGEIDLANETLWAPWRLDYVRANKNPNEATCFICRAVAENADRENWVVWRGGSSVVILNRFPYNNGHLLVAPQAHKGTLEELTDAEMLELMQTQRRMIQVLDRTLSPHGYNIGLNLGSVAGAGLPGHLHWHVVPRWNGDTNFMPVLSGTRVIVQSLESLFELMQQHRD
jgi:ATP adenylyltransferase